MHHHPTNREGPSACSKRVPCLLNRLWGEEIMNGRLEDCVSGLDLTYHLRSVLQDQTSRQRGVFVVELLEVVTDTATDVD